MKLAEIRWWKAPTPKRLREAEKLVARTREDSEEPRYGTAAHLAWLLVERAGSGPFALPLVAKVVEVEGTAVTGPTTQEWTGDEAHAVRVATALENGVVRELCDALHAERSRRESE